MDVDLLTLYRHEVDGRIRVLKILVEHDMKRFNVPSGHYLLN